VNQVAVSWINSQIVFDGVVQGLAIAVIAVGVILVYRATRIINFAVGGMGAVGAVILALLNLQYHVPFWPSFVIALIVGLLFGAAVDSTVVRRLRRAPKVVILVATIGIAQVAQAIAAEIPTPANVSARYPTALNGSWTVAGVSIHGSDLAVLILAPVTMIALMWFLDRTTLGKTVKACATNPELARVSSVSPKWVSTMVWSLAAGLSTLSIILIAGQSGSVGMVANLGPETLSRALAAAVIAGMASVRRAVIAAVVIGIVQNIITFNFLADPGVTDLVLFVVILIALGFYGNERGSGVQVFAFTPKSRPIPERLRSIWWIRHLNKGGVLLLALIGILLPIIVTRPSSQQLFSAVLAYAICASSLTVVTGWSGQLSLGQMAFAGIGALFAARLVFEGVPFWVTVLVTCVATAILAAVVGVGSLRVRGLYLAVVTFAFALAAQQYFYLLPVFSGESTDGVTVPYSPGRLFFLTFSGQRTYYYVVLVILALVIVLLSRFRSSSLGRTTKAVRDNETAAAAFTVVPSLTKVRAFVVAGALAGLGGALLSGAFGNIPFVPNGAGGAGFFLVNGSLSLVAIVVIGGMGSVTGAVLGAIWVVGIPAFAPNNQVVGLLTSSIGLLVILLYFPRGLNQIVSGVRDAIVDWADRRVGDREAPAVAPYPAAVRRAEPANLVPGVPALAVKDLSVNFGGNLALVDASLTVGDGEIVGLIGSNGAGKSTLMNAVGGFVASRGSVQLLGEEIGDKSAARRASLGLGRTFQSATLFPELTVNETLLVALEAKRQTGTLSTAFSLRRANRHSRAAHSEVGELVGFLGLSQYRDSFVSDLSTGTRRVVELAGLLALNARVLCLDEPTAGLAQRETEAFGPLITAVQRELQASVLLIEHDMPVVMSISQRVYCLETGSVIAEGPPSEIQHDPRVIASYLGTDERAIARSGKTNRESSPPRLADTSDEPPIIVEQAPSVDR
jgi:ABC-type branched-subunit amino acid transport system ATPase component/ABC-type branched-subunit amino acid transport system permease subunit